MGSNFFEVKARYRYERSGRIFCADKSIFLQILLPPGGGVCPGVCGIHPGQQIMPPFLPDQIPRPLSEQRPGSSVKVPPLLPIAPGSRSFRKIRVSGDHHNVLMIIVVGPEDNCH